MQPKSYRNPKIAMLNIELELKAEKDNAEIRVDSVEVSTVLTLFDYEWLICQVAQWCSGLAIKRSNGTKLRNNLGQVVHIYAPLLPSSIIWYWSKDGNTLWLGR